MVQCAIVTELIINAKDRILLNTRILINTATVENKWRKCKTSIERIYHDAGKKPVHHRTQICASEPDTHCRQQVHANFQLRSSSSQLHAGAISLQLSEI